MHQNQNFSELKPASRRDSYLTIRNFFTSSYFRVVKPSGNSISLPIVHRTRYSSYGTSWPPSDGSQHRIQPKDIFAESDWLQDRDVVLPTFNKDYVAPPRFDWRMRASSRTRKDVKLEGRTQLNARRIRRHAPPVMDVQIGQPFFEEINAYQERFLPLLAAEQAQDESILKERLSTWTLDRLKEEGYCLTGLAAFWLDATQFGRPVAAFNYGPGITLPDNRFESGTQVLVSRIDPLRETPVRGSVVSHTPTHLRVSFEEKFGVGHGVWRLDVGRSNIIFDRMRTAISHFHHDTGALERANLSSTPDRELIFHGTHLRDILLRSFSPDLPAKHVPLQDADDVHYISHETLDHGSRQSGDHGGAFKDDMRIQSWAKRFAEVNPVRVEGDPVLTGLNVAQTRAMAMMIGERISLVQGPPGTGKTKTIIETVKLLKVHFEVVHPILVCTYTNVAVDNLVEGFAKAGVKALRVAFGGKVKASLEKYTLGYRLDHHPLRPEADRLANQERQIYHDIVNLKKMISKLEASGQHQNRLDCIKSDLAGKERIYNVVRAKQYALKERMLRDILSEADVICTTCITSAAVSLNVIDFPVVFLDEASMSTEPVSLIPIMKGSRHIALIGDHKQLPPVITSPEAQANGLGISLFERLTEEGVVPSIMLDVQYRMHPSISRFPSSEFYNFSLHDGTVDSAGNILASLTPPSSSHLPVDASTGNRPSVVFLDHAGSESLKDRSRVNHNEANIVCSVVEDLLLQNEDLRGEDIGIIAPYAAQISLLNRLFNVNTTYRDRFNKTLGEHRAMQLANVEIKTVDGFEGREKAVIIFSTVRNNPGGHIGFLADRRRLNVGLTRAKRALFVVGSMTTLKIGKMSQGTASDGQTFARVGNGAEAWRRYAEFLNQENMVVQLSGERLTKLLYGNVARKSMKF